MYLGKRMIFTDLKSQKMPCNFWTNLEIPTIVYIYILAEKTLTEKSLLGILQTIPAKQCFLTVLKLTLLLTLTLKLHTIECAWILEPFEYEYQ